MSIYWFNKYIMAAITFVKDVKLPIRWDEVHRAQVRAELDAYYARYYGLTRDESRYNPCWQF